MATCRKTTIALLRTPLSGLSWDMGHGTWFPFTAPYGLRVGKQSSSLTIVTAWYSLDKIDKIMKEGRISMSVCRCEMGVVKGGRSVEKEKEVFNVHVRRPSFLSLSGWEGHQDPLLRFYAFTLAPLPNTRSGKYNWLPTEELAYFSSH